MSWEPARHAIGCRDPGSYVPTKKTSKRNVAVVTAFQLPAAELSADTVALKSDLWQATAVSTSAAGTLPGSWRATAQRDIIRQKLRDRKRRCGKNAGQRCTPDTML